MKAYWLDLGLLNYEPAFALQEQVLKGRLEGRLPPVVIVQENYPVFTIGKSGSEANILATPEELARRGIQVLHVNRGGDVTYHAPGQLIVSPLLYLGDVGLNANEYLHRLEDVLIALLADFGLGAGKVADRPGVWMAGERKIGAVGIAVRHGFAFHGFSLNVDLDLAPFSLINPCGMAGMVVTSMKEDLGRAVDMAEVKARVRERLEETFTLELVDW